MKLLPTLILSAAMFLPVAQADTKQINQECAKIAEVGMKVMTIRQANYSMVDLMTKADGDEFLEELIIAAYKAPLWATKENKQKEIKEFTNHVFMFCIQEFRSRS